MCVCVFECFGVKEKKNNKKQFHPCVAVSNKTVVSLYRVIKRWKDVEKEREKKRARQKKRERDRKIDIKI